MREKLDDFDYEDVNARITPAYAGKTAKRSSSQASITSKNGQIYLLLLQAMLSALHPQAPYVAVFQ